VKIFLTVAGYVEKFATITPQKVRLSGLAGQELKKDVRIIPEKNYPFKIIDVTTKENPNIKFKLEEIKNSKRIEYVLTIQNLKKEKGKYHDTIQIKTDSNVKPEIQIQVYGNICEKTSKKNK
jgi:hypothetical protein